MTPCKNQGHYTSLKFFRFSKEKSIHYNGKISVQLIPTCFSQEDRLP